MEDEMKLKAIGVTCGIGSLLVGARAAGFEVAGQLEWRRYYFAEDEFKRNTFRENFPGAVFKHRFEDLEMPEIERLMNADIALGHPECGHFSQLSSMNKDQTTDPADIPLFVDLIAKLQPRFFVMDDLPKSFLAFPMAEYARRLPGYDLFPEWISNYGYGNVQKNRKRMFMLGAKKEEEWAFIPGEADHATTLADILGDLPEPRRGSNVPNHDPHTLDEICGRAKHLVTLGRDKEATYAQLREFFLSVPPGATLAYVSRHERSEENEGKPISSDLIQGLIKCGLVDKDLMEGGNLVVKCKPGHARGYWDGHAYVLDGASIQVHPTRGTPYTVRERARIQGFPDDFVFYGTKFNAAGEWNHEKNVAMIKQTGKAMPVQFATYVSKQVAAHILDEPFETTGARLLAPNEHIDRAKQWYCEEVGYANQARACAACWLYPSCTIRMRKYGIGSPARGQLDLIDSGIVPGPDSDLEPSEVEKPTKVSQPRPVKTPKIVVAKMPKVPRSSARFAELAPGAGGDINFGADDE